MEGILFKRLRAALQSAMDSFVDLYPTYGNRYGSKEREMPG